MYGNPNSSVDEIVKANDCATGDKRSNGNNYNHSDIAFSKKAQHQCDADENLFLRFLELDPPVTDTASRQSSLGKGNGRTPFTITKKLVKSPENGFGFSIVWTHPPRIEKVESNLSAEKSGILPGDYVIFIDKYNIVTMPELDILNLIRTQGNTLILEIFRRPTRQGSIKMATPRLVTTAATNRQISTDEESSFKPSQFWSSSAMSNTSLETTKKRLRLPQVEAISKEVRRDLKYRFPQSVVTHNRITMHHRLQNRQRTAVSRNKATAENLSLWCGNFCCRFRRIFLWFMPSRKTGSDERIFLSHLERRLKIERNHFSLYLAMSGSYFK